MVRIIAALVVCSFSSQLLADTIRVPGDFKTIQAAIDSAKPGDIVLVSAGQYAERIKLKPGISVRSAGDDSKGLKGLKRAEKTILDGGGKKGMHPGVIMAEGSTFDGFTVTNVGTYDKAVWQEHFDTHGENLSDDHGSVQDEKTISGISIPNVNCKVTNNIVHHNGNVGIAIIGNKNRSPTSIVSGNIAYRNLGSGIGAANFAQPIIQNNICFENLRAGIGCRNSSPLILDNECFKNIRAGIGCREKAKAIMRGNKCFQNRRAGIGIRMQGTAPIVEDNKCFENHMAGIGTRDGAMPILRNNNCYKNLMAGIGCDGSKSIVVDNRCRENKMAGIGVRGGAQVTILRNKCIENKLVAIGVIQKSSATIIDNQLKRTGGVPPIVAVKDGSSALLKKNNIEGGGVAAILIQGTATVAENSLLGKGKKQGNAIWVWENSNARILDNSFDGYRGAVNATKSSVVVTGSQIRRFQNPAISIKQSIAPAHVFGNRAISKDRNAKVVQIQGAAGIVTENVVAEDARANETK